MNPITKHNKKFKGKFPCFYEYFTEIKPQKVLCTSVKINKYNTQSYACKAFYKNISLFSI